MKLRKWQAYAMEQALKTKEKGIFIEAAGGKGKTFYSLELCKRKGAKRVLVTNNQLNILRGWRKEHERYKDDFELVAVTQKSLDKVIADNPRFDILIVDEWQNGSSDANCKKYAKIKRDFTIGLSATPERQKGLNYFNMEKTIWGKPEPKQFYNWQLTWGKMVYDRFAYSKTKWDGFRDFEEYKAQLPLFISYEFVDKLDNAVENNGYKIKEHKYTYKVASGTAKGIFDRYNLYLDNKNNTTLLASGHFGKRTFESLITKTIPEIKDGKLVPTEAETPFLELVERMISGVKNDTMIVCKQKSVAELIHKLNPGTGLMTGDEETATKSKVVIATQQKIGVGVDGLQHKFKNLVICDPVDPGSGEYNDYKQLLWRITGSRQQQDINLITLEVKE